MSLDVLFVNPNSSKANYQELANLYSAIEPPTWSLLLAAALRKKGFGVGILDCDALRLSPEEAVEKIRDADPRLVCFVTYGQNPNSGTTNMWGTLEIARVLKDIYNYPTMSIGSHTSALPHEVLNTGLFDFVAINEGMRTLVALLNTDMKTDLHLVKGLGYLEDGKARVNNGVGTIVPTASMDEEYPGYAWDLLPYKEKPLDLYRSHFWHTNYEHGGRTPFAAIYTSLGCVMQCSFCCISIVNRESEQEGTHAAHSNKMRFWSPEWAFNVVKDLVENYGVETLRFSDEMFTLNRKYYVPLLQKIVDAGYGEKLRTWAYARVDTIMPKNLDLMRKSGIRYLGIGIECLAKGTKILTNSGIKNIENISTIDKVINYDLNSNKIVTSNILQTFKKQTKCLNIQTNNLNISCGEKHKFLLLNENCDIVEKQAKDLTTNDFILVSPENGIDISNNSINPEVAQLIGFAIGDGHIGKDCIRITGGRDQKLLMKKYQKIAKKHFNCNARLYFSNKREQYILSLSGKDTVMKFFNDLKLIGTKSHNKFVPEQIQLSNNKAIAGFIAGLWDSDGCFYYKNRKNGISSYISFNNKKLLEDVKYLLLYRLGIHSSLIKTRIDNRWSETKYQYTIYIKRYDSLLKFKKNIPIFHKLKYNYLCQYLKSCPQPRTRSIFIPLEVINEITSSVYGKMLKLHKLGIKFHYITVRTQRQWKISLDKFNKIRKYLHKHQVVVGPKYEKYLSILDSGLQFEKIKKIAQTKKQTTYDLVIDTNNNYFANGFLVHNSGDISVRQEIDKGRFREVNIREMREELRSHDINGGLNYIFGFPSEGYKELEATKSLMFELMGEFTNIYCATALPGSPLYYEAVQNGWELPKTLDGYGFYAYEHLPLRTHHLTAAEVLKFRDDTWMEYYTNPVYLSFIERKFGKVARSNIEDQTKIKLKRRILND